MDRNDCVAKFDGDDAFGINGLIEINVVFPKGILQIGLCQAAVFAIRCERTAVCICDGCRIRFIVGTEQRHLSGAGKVQRKCLDIQMLQIAGPVVIWNGDGFFKVSLLILQRIVQRKRSGNGSHKFGLIGFCISVLRF